MKTRAAVLWGLHQEWQIEEIDLDGPKAGEVLVKWEAAGLCHSDEHLVTGDVLPDPSMLEQFGLPPSFPIIGGHEGAGTILEVGEGVRGLRVGDHIAASFIPACGRCRFCVSGRSSLCDMGARVYGHGQISDRTDRHHLNGEGVPIVAKLGTFAEHGVINEASAIKVDPDLPMEVVALVSCGVATGYGSAIYRAEVKPGETVVVVGVGGIGINAVQGAHIAGARNIVAVDPIELKQKTALELGATHVASSMSEATQLVSDLTRGVMADSVILTPSLMYGDLLAPALSLTAKGGTCVVTAVAPLNQRDVVLDLFELAMWQKEIRGAIFGGGSPRNDIPILLDLYRNGQLKLDELVTRTYPLEEINQGYEDMRAGRNIRGVLVM
ncbi:MAG: NDMA-dependent alcohol dehydrogenase [Acidimicrobiales bacterium]|jgi:S-(hydroxymethyl)glutathione dehydrogenase/alcohol dehydrogenase